MEDAITKYWLQLTTIIVFAVWLVKMESKVKNNEQDIQELKGSNKEETKVITDKLEAMNNKLNDLCISFAEFSGYMKRCKEDEK